MKDKIGLSEPSRSRFKAVFLNRLEDQTIDQNLRREELRQIVSLQLEPLHCRLAGSKLGLSISAGGKDLLANTGSDQV